MYDRMHKNRKVSARVFAAMLAAAMSMTAAPVTFADETEVSTEANASDKKTTEAADSEKDVEGTDKNSGDSDQDPEDGKKEYTQLETTGTKDAKVTAIDVSDIVEACMPSIVTISEKSVQEVEDYFGGSQKVEEEGAASGFIIAQTSDELLIATNNHVVKNATDVTVAFSVDVDNDDDKVVPAKVKGADPGTDVAVVAVQLSDIKEDVLGQLKIAVLGNSDDLKVGQTAITIGNTLGQGLTVTSGIVAALNCTVETKEGTWTEFQTDGAANEGQSGGAVLNADGEVIGIFNAGYLEGDNIGYAVPISTAIPVLQNLINRKTRDALDDYGYLGIMVAPVTDEASQIYNIPQGAYVASVEEGSAAEKAGIQKGDVITGFDGLTVDTRDTLLDQIRYYAPGEKVKITYQRADGSTYKEETCEVTLDEATDEVKEARKQQDASSAQEGPDDSQNGPDDSQNGPDDSQDGSDDSQSGSDDSRDGSDQSGPDGGITDPPSDENGGSGSGELQIPWDEIFGGQNGQGGNGGFLRPEGGSNSSDF